MQFILITYNIGRVYRRFVRTVGESIGLELILLKLMFYILSAGLRTGNFTVLFL